MLNVKFHIKFVEVTDVYGYILDFKSTNLFAP